MNICLPLKHPFLTCFLISIPYPFFLKINCSFNQTYLLSKASWDFTVSNISKTWVIQNLDNIVSRYIREWFELPITATLSGLILSKNQFGLSLQLPSMKFLQCQAVQRNILKSSLNESIQSLWKTTCEGSNIQYDLYRNTKEVLKAVRTEHTRRLQHELTLQGAILSFLIDNSLKMANSIWSDVQSNMPRNIFNFTVRYLNNSLQLIKILLDGILAKPPIVLSAFTLKVYYMFLQAIKRALMKGVLHGVTIQH